MKISRMRLLALNSIVKMMPSLNRRINRGNGRRYLALAIERQLRVPEQVMLADTPTTHIAEIADEHAIHAEKTKQQRHSHLGCINSVEIAGGHFTLVPSHLGSDVKMPQLADLPLPVADPWCKQCRLPLSSGKCYTFYIGAPGGLKRPPGSKVLYDGRAFYFIMTWTDFFGAPIRESELGIKRAHSRSLYLRKASKAEHAICMAAVERWFDAIAGDYKALNLDTNIWSWHMNTPAKMLRQIANEHQYDLTPVLADALEEAGCCDTALLHHLRHWPHHDRDCYAINLLIEDLDAAETWQSPILLDEDNLCRIPTEHDLPPITAEPETQNGDQ